MGKVRRVIFRLLKRRIWLLAGVVLTMLAATGFSLLTPWPFKLLIDNVLGGELIDTSTWIGKILAVFTTRESLGVFVVFLYLSSNVFANLFVYAKSIVSSLVINKLEYEFSEQAFNNLEAFDYGFFRNRDIGDYIYRLSYDVSALYDLLDGGIFPITTSLLFLSIATVVLYSIDVRLTLLSLTVIPLLAISLVILNNLTTRASKRSETSNSILYSYVQQTLSQLKIIQAYSREKTTLDLYNRKMASSLDYEFRLFRLNFILSMTTGIIIALTYSLIIGLGIRSIFTGQLTAGLLLVFLYYLDNLTSPIITIIYAVSSIKQSTVRIGRLGEFFNSRYHIHDTGMMNCISDTSIEYRHVSLDGDHGEKILSDISCGFPAGSFTAVVGVSGSGKTSMTGLLLRFIDKPDDGEILIGGENILEYKLTVLRQTLAYVPQEPILPDETIRHIIAFGKESVTEDEIRNAARLAGADEFIERHPGGYDFKVGEQGNLLSGGQRQRLMLARAFVRNARILVLDEIFASVDPKTRKYMLDNLRKYAIGKTVILVTNQLDILEDSDRVIIMRKGKITHTGVFGELKIQNFMHTLMNSHQ